MITIGWLPYKKGKSDEWETDITVELPSGLRDRKRRKCEERWVGHPDRTRSIDQNRPKAADRWAMRLANTMREELLDAEKDAEAKQPAPLFEAYWPDFLAWCRSDCELGTVNSRVSHGDTWLLPAFTGLRLDQIDNVRVMALWVKIGNIPSRPNVMATVSKCLHRAIVDAKLAAMPCTFGRDTGVFLGTKRPRQKNAHYHEYDAMVTAAESIGPEALVAYCLGADASMRVSEIIGLEWFLVSSDCVKISQQLYRGIKKSVKGSRREDKTRSVPLTDRLKRALAQLPKRTWTGSKKGKAPPGSYVLSNEDGSPYGYKKMQLLLATIEAAAKVNPSGKDPKLARTHKLRHTCCSRLARLGAKINEIQAVAGHANITETAGYMHLSPDALPAVIARLNDGETVEKRGTERPKR